VVISHPVNLGKGASLIKGFSYALEKGFDAVITMDGDGQHLPEDIFFFMRVAKYSPSAIFVGNRMHKARNMPPVRLLTNKFMSWLVSFVAKQKIPDTQCGFRLIKKEVLKKVSLHTSKYETESEILIKASRHGFKIEPVMIKTIYRGEKSQINPLIDSFRFVRFILREIWAAGS
jgi:glycosyltransferase involved in cell wall biosynthesis